MPRSFTPLCVLPDISPNKGGDQLFRRLIQSCGIGDWRKPA